MMILLPFLVLQAHAEESIPAALHFSDFYDAFDRATDYDTGPLAFSGFDSVAVRFYVGSSGKVQSELDAESHLSWPDALTHELNGLPQGGKLSVGTRIGVYMEVILNFSGLYNGRINLWSADLAMSASQTFDGLLLNGDSPEIIEVIADGTGIDQVRLPWSPVTGLEIALLVDLYPEALATLTNDRIETEITGEPDLSIMTTAGESTLIGVPGDSAAEVQLRSSYFGQYTVSQSVVFEPSGQACVFGSCYQFSILRIPVPLIDATDLREFRDQTYAHPLPFLSMDNDAFDFGEVLVDQIGDIQIALTNFGLMDLVGTASIIGSDKISVFPEHFSAAPNYTDGIVLTFAPDAIEDTEATLVIESNDPVAGHLEIPLFGTSYEPVEPTPPPLSSDSGESIGINTCGCSASSLHGSLGVLPLLGLFLLRRRRAL